MEKIIELKNLTKNFDDQQVLKGINLDIHHNEFLTLLGPSGCGKTTTLRIIAGFEEASSGEVLFDGMDISKIPAYKREINTVFQKYALFPHMNVFDNVAFGLNIKKMENAGLKVVALRSAELDSVKENLQIIAAVCQKEERGEQLVQYIDEGIEEVTSCLADVSEEDKPTVVELYSDMNVSVKQYDHWMIPSGAKNPAEDLTGKMAEVDMEQMLLWNPDIIYIGNHSDLMPSDLLENKQEGRDWSVINAVKNHQVYKIPIGAYRWDPAGVETPLMVKWAAKIQYPDIFANMDMKEEVKEFFELVYQYELTDEQVSEILDNRQK